MTPTPPPSNTDREILEQFSQKYLKPNYTDMATALGISKSYMSKLKNGTKPLTPELKIKIARLRQETKK